MIKILIIILALLMAAIGGERGIKSFVSLFGNAVILLIAVFLMAIGFNVIVITVIMTFSLCGVTLFYQNGNNEKTRTAFYVVIIVSMMILFLVILLSSFAGISGYNEISIYEEDTTFYDNNIHVNMMQVAAAVIIIGILGAVKDSAVAVTSGVYEVFRHNPKIEMEELFYAGLHMGYDILGTAVNTLFFACVGESMLLINRFYRLNYSFLQLINSKAFFQQLIIVVTGSIGIVLSIPIAAFVMIKVLSYNSSE
ncbi:YibE/F family protein [Lacrimispora sp. 38-1]|uniref:YibE/F family protein n=1 Tax=Lacrimispora sp. 38-1 TaxID=3125778 RepID=UPI003CF160BE